MCKHATGEEYMPPESRQKKGKDPVSQEDVEVQRQLQQLRSQQQRHQQQQQQLKGQLDSLVTQEVGLQREIQDLQGQMQELLQEQDKVQQERHVLERLQEASEQEQRQLEAEQEQLQQRQRQLKAERRQKKERERIMVTEFCEQHLTDEATARWHLEASGWDLERAMGSYMPPIPDSPVVGRTPPGSWPLLSLSTAAGAHPSEIPASRRSAMRR